MKLYLKNSTNTYALDSIEGLSEPHITFDS
jgi:hypothetical protein